MTISLSSIGYKIISVLVSLALTCLTIVLFIFLSQIKWYEIAFSIIVTVFCFLGCFMCFKHRIVLNENKGIIKICGLKTKIIKLNELLEIKVDTDNSVDENKYCFIKFILKDGQQFKIDGVSVLFNKKNSVNITKQKVDELIRRI